MEATVVGWRLRDVGNDVSLPTRDGGDRDLQDRISSNVGRSQHKPRRALEKFRKSGADPAFPEQRLARIASAIKNVLEIEKSRSEST